MTFGDIKPRVVVIGLGAYFKKLRQGVYEYFEVERLIDSKPLASLNLLPDEYHKFLQTSDDLNSLAVDNSVDCFLLLTPPALHVPLIEHLASSHKPIFVEKPIAISSDEVARLKAAVEENPKIYCSDFYPDVRAVPLLSWVHPDWPTPLKSEVQFIRGEKRLWDSGLSGLGTIERVEGKILEGLGSSWSFDGRDWLWNPSQGGVLLDLVYHFLTLSFYLFHQNLIAEKVTLETWQDGRVVPWEPTLNLAETYALIEGRFFNGAALSFEVAKYWKAKTEKRFTLYCRSGRASVLLNDPNILLLEAGSQQCWVQLEGNYHTHVMRCFNDYVQKNQDRPYGLEQGLWAVDIIDKLKKAAF